MKLATPTTSTIKQRALQVFFHLNAENACLSSCYRPFKAVAMRGRRINARVSLSLWRKQMAKMKYLLETNIPFGFLIVGTLQRMAPPQVGKYLTFS